MITETTRRNIFDVLRVQKINWAGNLNDIEFLSRLFDLKAMPTTDPRTNTYRNAEEDIWQHRINNNDWSDDWIFSDERFNLLRCDDDLFLRFVCEILHPLVHNNKEEIEQLKHFFNEYLTIDGYEIYQSASLADHPVYSNRRVKAPVAHEKNANFRTSRPISVFLCYAKQDILRIRKIYKQLDNEYIEVWLDEEKLIAGQNWRHEITKSVRLADVVLICLSKSSVSKEGFVQREIKLALDVALEKPEGTIFIIPLRLEECEVPQSLTDYHWVDYLQTDGMERLLSAIRTRAKSLGLTVAP